MGCFYSTSKELTDSRPENELRILLAVILSLLSDGDPLLSFYEHLTLLRRATGLGKEPDRNLNVAQNKYKLHHDQHVRLGPLFKESAEIYIDWPSLTPSATKKSASEVYNSF